MDTAAPRYFAANHAHHLVAQTLEGASVVRIATAYFEASGWQVLQDVLAGKQVRLLIGREEGGADRVEAVLREFAEAVLARPLQRRVTALRQMLTALENGQLLVAVGRAIDHAALLDPRYLYQHAKVYIADARAAVVCSSNFSHSGLVRGIEAGIRVESPEDVGYFVEQFDSLFGRAHPIAERLIAQLRELLGEHSPYEVYIRALLELYDLPEDSVPAALPALADYQRPVVSRTLDALQTHGGALLIASTGLGKTVMAAHIVAYLRMQGVIDHVIVICPAGLRENWRRFMNMGRTSSAEFSYSTLSVDDPARSSALRGLEYNLSFVNEKTLILLDESHHMRNDEDGDDLKLRYRRVFTAVHDSGARALLLTATPFSRGMEDVNAQLRLLPKSTFAAHDRLLKDPTYWKASAAAELSELPPCPTLTTPTVVKHFSHDDGLGHRYVVFNKMQMRYFPHRLNLKTVAVDNPLDGMLVSLLNSGFLVKAVPEKKMDAPAQRALFDDWDEEPLIGVKAGFFNAEVMKQCCSSPAQVLDLFAKLEKPGGFPNMRFTSQAELTNFVREYRKTVDALKAAGDPKYIALKQSIEQAGGKVVVFCHYLETAKWLTEKLRADGVKAETTASKKTDQVDGLLREFAPIANEVLEEEGAGRLDVLVVTGALAEGFNLQDAATLVNYDLPWTVLVLAQRMGRVLRPWREPREITIVNLVPSTLNNPQIHMALDWQRRLLERSEQHAAFAEIPVMVRRELGGLSSESGFEMAALARRLQTESAINLDLYQTLEFVSQAESFHTSSFLDDLALVKEYDRRRMMGLPAGFRSTKRTDGTRQLFLLLKARRRVYAVLFDRAGRVVMDAEQRDAIMQTIRSDPWELSALGLTEDETDEWIDRARDTWSEAHALPADVVQVVCALVMV